MEENALLTKTLTIAGVLLVWVPISASILSLLFASPTDMVRVSLFDSLRPALGPIGGGLLFWAALRAHSRSKLIGFGMVVMFTSLACGRMLAKVAGVPAGEAWPVDSPWWMLFVMSLEVSSLALMIAGFGGMLLLRDLFKVPQLPAEDI